MKYLLKSANRFLFFTGKGGVGKTSMASSTAVGLADMGKRVLLISTDPASNLDEVLCTPLSAEPTPVNDVPGLFAMNINPIQAAEQYRERMVGPYRGVLPDAAIQQMEEQLSGACTVEIAGFNEFSKFIGDPSLNSDFDHIVLDTAPTGHTLRLLNLPAAWNSFMAENQTGSSCLGPVAGLTEQKVLFAQVLQALTDESLTQLILVARAETMSLTEANRASIELRQTGLNNQLLIVNGIFESNSSDTIAASFADKSQAVLATMPENLKLLPQTRTAFRPSGVMGIAALRDIANSQPDCTSTINVNELADKLDETLSSLGTWDKFIDGLEKTPNGVIMTMGKGGVGKTTMAALIATELANRGHSVLLSTTDPAAHVADVVGSGHPNLIVDRIDPKIETEKYVESVMEKNRPTMSHDELALLEEEMGSPCIEEIAVFQAFAQTVAKGSEQYIVLDTAPTGHTLLLLDATQAYHREVAKSADALPDAVSELLPRIRDPKFTRIVVIALPEATPVHEAQGLQQDLRRANIEPYGWIINRSFAVSGTTDPILSIKGLNEITYIQKVAHEMTSNCVISPWVSEELNSSDNLLKLTQK